MKATLGPTNIFIYPAFATSSTVFSLFSVLFHLVQSINKAHSNNKKKCSILTIFFNIQSNLLILSAACLIPW